MQLTASFSLLAAALLAEGTPLEVDRRQNLAASASAIASSISAALASLTSAGSSATSSAASSATSSAATTSSTMSSAATMATTNSTASATSSTPSFTVVTPTAAGASPTLVKPDGGIGFNETPTYTAKSDYDYQSFNLGLHQELIELDLFHHGLALFSEAQFQEAGLGPEEMYLLQYMVRLLLFNVVRSKLTCSTG